MTREEAKTIFLNRGYIEVDGGTYFDGNKWRESIAVISEWLKEEPCEVITEIPKDYLYDTETEDFLVYRHKYTGDEIHIERPVPLYRLKQEPCEDAISRQAAIDGADVIIARDTSGNNDVVKAMTAWKSYVEGLPSVNPQEPKSGHWERISMDKYVQHAMAYYRCSECDKDIIGEHNYCPNCGAKME